MCPLGIDDPRVTGPYCGGGRFITLIPCVFGRPYATYFPPWHFVFSDTDGKEGVVDCFTVHPDLAALRNSAVCCPGSGRDVTVRG